MKHSPLSLLERAAELYDYGAVLRAPAPELGPEPGPVPPADEAEAAGEPVLELVVEAQRPARRTAARGIVAVDRERLAEAGLVVPGGPVTGLAEEVRLIKRQLLAGIERRVALPEEKRRTVLITSAEPDEGKSFCAVNLALSLAGEKELEVLLVDGDFSKPDALSMLGIEGGPGLVDALADPAADPEAFVIRTDIPGLSVLPAGAKANNVPELLASARTRELLARLIAAGRNRLVLIDSPPALMASPAAVLAGHVGQALVVVRADSTTESDLRETIALVSGCDHVALILNAAGIALTGRRYGAYEGCGDEA